MNGEQENILYLKLTVDIIISGGRPFPGRDKAYLRKVSTYIICLHILDLASDYISTTLSGEPHGWLVIS